MATETTPTAWYPRKLAVGSEGSTPTQHFIANAIPENAPFHYAEFGIYEGATADFVANNYPNAHLHLFDFDEVLSDAQSRLSHYGTRIHYYGCSQRYNDSYNWQLHKLIAKKNGLSFDYCFLDGAHTYAIDALTYFLCDLLLKPGGYLDFDDYDWRLRGSSLDPSRIPAIGHQYTDEQIDAFQVKMIVDDLVRPSGRYAEVIKNRVFRKTAAW